MTDIWRSPGGEMELRCGRWQDVLADVTECDAVITDPPYSPRQHLGFRSGNDYSRHNVASAEEQRARLLAKGVKRDRRVAKPMSYGAMPYAPIDDAYCADFMARWSECELSWFVIFSDHTSFRMWESAAIAADWYTFAPVVWLRGRMPRFQGDGPSSDCEYALVARPRRTTKCGSLPGHYRIPPPLGATEHVLTGQKPLALMREIVKDYTWPGDLIVEPHAGSGTTLLAAAMEGRRCIGAEMDLKTFALAVKRLSKGYNADMFQPRRPGIVGKQEDLL